MSVAINGSRTLWFHENRLTDPIVLDPDEHIYYEGWTLMSVPYDLAGYPATAEDVIGDDEAPRDIDVGMGFWFGVAHADTNVIDVTGDVVSGDFSMPIEQEWNMLGYPFLEGSDIDDWLIPHEGTDYSMADAADSMYVVPIIHVAAPEFGNWGYWYHFGATDHIEPWYGFWFLALVEDLTLTIPEPGPVPPEIDEEEPAPVTWNDWTARVFATNEDLFASSLEFGVAPDAVDEYDIDRDWPEPLPMPEDAEQNLRAVFIRTNWLDVASEYTADIRAPFEPEQTKTWSFRVYGDGTITMTWPGVDVLLPDGYTAQFEDVFSCTTVDMLAVDEYTFELADAHSFNVHITATGSGAGERDPVALPLTPVTESVYPNPFNPAVTIAYSLPSVAHVTVTVYDVLGREVATLINARRSVGRHQTAWNAAGNPAGVYFIRMQAEGVTAMRKAVLLK
ncbi:MAG: hypothetical protein MAG453_01620 [Calditrichaeota bacterium]|nr:hypothetical protein [Calditrichota bacterium]